MSLGAAIVAVASILSIFAVPMALQHDMGPTDPCHPPWWFLVVGLSPIVTLLAALAAIVAGHLARREERRLAGVTSGLTIVGLALGYACLGFLVLATLGGAVAFITIGHGAPAPPPHC